MAIYRLLICSLMLFATLLINAQDYNYAFLVEFTDKNNTIYSTENPLEYLSERAIERRMKYNIEITEQDFPVNRWYVDSIIAFDAKLHVTSRWFNSAVFRTNNISFSTDLKGVSFVKNISLIYQRSKKKSAGISKLEQDSDSLAYGSSRNQITMCNAQKMHKKGYRGNGVHIAVMDAGFSDVDKIACFDTLWVNNQIIDSWDFVEGKGNVFDSHSHGTKVLSTIAGNLPGKIIGSAPKAFYYLYRTEDGASEFPIEEENWIAAAETADSAGVDIITTSLGYSVFDMPELNYTYNDMDGKTTRITQGSEVAFTKGMVLITSAGNEGNKPWKYLTAPSDGENVLCVGAVDPEKKIASFSGLGPSADGRVKPDVVAQGALVSVINTDGIVIESNGTSFSCPIMAGMVACVWQAMPNLSNKEVLSLVKSYGHKYNNPDYIYGNGLPDFSKLIFTLDSIDYEKPNENKIDNLYPNPFKNNLKLRLYIKKEQTVKIKLTNAQGKIVLSSSYKAKSETLNLVKLAGVEYLPNGYYVLSVITNSGVLTEKILKY